MQISMVSLMVSLAGAVAIQLEAQPASPELQGKALELLRQTISQQQQRPPGAQTTPQVTPQQAPAQAKPQVTAPTTNSGSLEQQQQAIQLLRERMAQEEAARKVFARPTPGAKATTGTATKPTPPLSPTAPVKQSGATNVAPPTEPSAPMPALSGTKQERLAELLELYKADKITPAQYHAERVKILAEP